MKYKVGDKVRVIGMKEAEKQEANDDCSFLKVMKAYCNDIVTITHAPSYGTGLYHIAEDNGDFYWVDEFFVGLAEENKPIKTSKEEKEDIANMLFDRIYTTAKFDTDKGINLFKHDMEILREFVDELIEEV